MGWIQDLLEIKFGVQGVVWMERIRQTKDIEELEHIKEHIKRAQSKDEIANVVV